MFFDGPGLAMNIQDNHFTLFGLPERFAIDAGALDRAYRDVQSQVHPDRFAGQGATEQRVALQWATRANEAYGTLRDPLKRAVYLCVLHGQDPTDERNTSMPQAFLLQQLAWREALDDAPDDAAIDALWRQLEAKAAELRGAVEQALDHDGDAVAATERVREWMFVERFGDDVRSARQRAGAH